MSAPPPPDPPAPQSRALLPEFARLLLLAVLLPTLALAAVIVWRGSAAAREQTAARLTAAAESTGREIDSFLQVHLAALQVLAEQRTTAGDLDDADAWRTDLGRVLKYYPAFATMLVADRDGRLLLSVPPAPDARAHSVADRAYYREPRRTGRPLVSDAFRGRVLGDEPLFSVSAPLRDRRGRFAGVVEGSIPAAALAERSQWLRERGIELLLLDRNDVVVQASAGLPYRPLDPLRGDARAGALRGLLQGGQAGVRRLPGVLRDGGDGYALAMGLDNGWRMVLLQSERLVQAELRRGLALMFAVLGLVLSIMLLFVVRKMRLLGGSVHALLARMQEFALDRDSDPIAAERLPRELAPLGEAMNRLAERLRDAYEDVSASLHMQSRLRENLQAVARRLITLQEDERRTLSRELHDDIGQSITAMKLGATALSDPDPARQQIVDEIVAIADQTAAKLRNLSLLLRPPQLDALGLEAALAGQVERLSRNTPVRIELRVMSLPQRPPQTHELACFRIAQEALTNALRYANAGTIEVVVEQHADALRLRVCDDGDGFDPSRPRGLGLLTMRERAQQLGGSLTITTDAGEGTCVRATLPLPRMPLLPALQPGGEARIAQATDTPAEG